MKKSNSFLYLLLTIILLAGCNNEPENEVIEEPPVVFTKEGELELKKSNGEIIRELDIEIADNDYERQTGLMYRESLGTDEGMLFIFPNEAPRAFYMKNTYIPLDIIYFNSDSTAVSFQKNARPMDETSLPSEEPAQFVLEINAGLVDEWNIEIGDKISFERL